MKTCEALLENIVNALHCVFGSHQYFYKLQEKLDFHCLRACVFDFLHKTFPIFGLQDYSTF